METPDYTEQRGELLQSIEHDEAEVRVAVQELAGAAQVKLDLGEHIKRFPVAWLIGGFLLGLWIGDRPISSRRREL